MLYFSLIIAATFAVGYGQLNNCIWVNRLDCSRYGSKVECGTDYVDYTNRCFFAKAQCKNANLHIISESTCVRAGYTRPATVPPATTAGPAATTARPAATTGAPSGPVTTRAPVFLGHNAVFDFFCLELAHETCPDDTEQVCGSDNKTYDNFCEFEKQRCSHRHLTVKDYGACI